MGATCALSVSALLAILGAGLIGLAFGTNNWRILGVDRTRLAQTTTQDANDVQTRQVERQFFNRKYGFFRVCYTSIDQPSVLTYTSPLGDFCQDVNYNESVDESMSPLLQEFIHLKKASLAFYVVGLSLSLLSLLFLVVGCGRRSSCCSYIAGTFLWFAGSFVVASLGIWHRVWYILDNNVLPDEISKGESRPNWSPGLLQNTSTIYGWSYICCWVGSGLLLLASVVMCASGALLRKDRKRFLEREKQQRMMYASTFGYDKPGDMSYPMAYGPYATYASPYDYAYSYYAPYYGYGNQPSNYGNSMMR